MTRDEAKRMVAVITAAYPNWHPENLSLTVDTWAYVLENYSYSRVSMALKAFILSDTSGFAPSIGQLIELMDRLGKGSELNEMEAWALVSNALRRSTYYAKEEFGKLPETVQRAVGSPSMLRHWAQTEVKSVESVIQSNFMRTYRQELENRGKLRRIPNTVRTALEAAGESLIEEN